MLVPVVEVVAVGCLAELTGNLRHAFSVSRPFSVDDLWSYQVDLSVLIFDSELVLQLIYLLVLLFKSLS